MTCQRETQRQTKDWVAYYQRPGLTGDWLNPVDDISFGGSFLRTSKPMQPGQSFQVILISKSSPTIVSTAAEVMWTGRKDRHRGMGIRFRHNAMSRRAIQDIIG